MFTVEIKINGTLTGHIYARNIEDLPDGSCLYEYDYYEPHYNALLGGRSRIFAETGFARSWR